MNERGRVSVSTGNTDKSSAEIDHTWARSGGHDQDLAPRPVQKSEVLPSVLRLNSPQLPSQAFFSLLIILLFLPGLSFQTPLHPSLSSCCFSYMPYHHEAIHIPHRTLYPQHSQAIYHWPQALLYACTQPSLDISQLLHQTVSSLKAGASPNQSPSQEVHLIHDILSEERDKDYQTFKM